MRVGVHASVRRGFASAAREAAALGCETLQIFTQSPRGWRRRVFSEHEFEEFRAVRSELGLDPVVVHSPYLPNLCTSDDDMYRRSSAALRDDLARSEKLGAEFLVIHPGAFSPGSSFDEGRRRLGSAINEALHAVPGRVRILIENMAGGGRRVGGSFEELAAILGSIRDQNRVGVCFDTCHAFAAGYDLSRPESTAEAMEAFDRIIGLRRIFVFHVNDSKGGLGCRRDLHQHIGEGNIGEAGFRALFSRREFGNCALILETPKLPMPESDLRNLGRLRSCLPGAAGRDPSARHAGNREAV